MRQIRHRFLPAGLVAGLATVLFACSPLADVPCTTDGDCELGRTCRAGACVRLVRPPAIADASVPPPNDSGLVDSGTSDAGSTDSGSAADATPDAAAPDAVAPDASDSGP